MFWELVYKWAVPFVCGAAISYCISLIAQNKAIKNGVQCLLRAEIITQHDKWSAREYCPIYAKEALSKSYKAYHALGGNDVATELYKRTMELPSELPQDRTL